jgi:hypothetical protein
VQAALDGQNVATFLMKESTHHKGILMCDGFEYSYDADSKLVPGILIVKKFLFSQI